MFGLRSGTERVFRLMIGMRKPEPAAFDLVALCWQNSKLDTRAVLLPSRISGAYLLADLPVACLTGSIKVDLLRSCLCSAASNSRRIFVSRVKCTLSVVFAGMIPLERT